MFIVFKQQYSNAFDSIFLRFEDISIVFNALNPPKDFSPMTLTLSPRVTLFICLPRLLPNQSFMVSQLRTNDSKLLHPLKKYCSIRFTFFGIVKVVNPVQPLNASVPIDAILPPITIEVRSMHS